MAPDRLFIAAKAPRPGLAKTRLGAVIGHHRAAALYAAFLTDLGARFRGSGWYVTPGDAWPEIACLVSPRATGAVAVQPAGDWTRRQRHLLRSFAGQGEGAVVLVASDSPHLSTAYVNAAFTALGDHDLVLGPTHDGGYALIGLRRWHDVLDGIGMSEARVVDQILERAAAMELQVHLLPVTFDVDQAADLRLLREELRRRDDLPATAAALRGLDGVA